MSRGLFLTFEGIEGCGKTTQIRRLAEWLAARNERVVTTREPGGTALGAALRRLLLDPSLEAPGPMAESFLYLADRAQHMHEVVLPGLRRGEILLCDRHADATVVYQGIARGLGRETTAGMNRAATGGVLPDRTFLLDLSVEEGLRRIRERRRLDAASSTRMDDEPAEFHEIIRRGYLELAGGAPDRIQVIDAQGSEIDVHRRIVEFVLPLLEQRKD